MAFSTIVKPSSIRESCIVTRFRSMTTLKLAQQVLPGLLLGGTFHG